MKKLFLLLWVLAISAVQAGFLITENGEPASSVVIPENAPKTVKYAANEFVDFIYRMSGAKLSITTDRKTKNPVFIGFDTEKFEIDQLKIACDGNALTLTGGGEYGSLMAVYAFLRDQGILWPYMEEMWLEIPQKKTVSIENINLVKKPHFHWRNLHNFPKDYERHFRWMAFNGWRYRAQNPPGTLQLSAMLARGIRPAFGCHSWAFWAGRKALNEHIEWNPLLDGKRTPPPLSGPPWWSYSQLCIGNAELRKHILTNMLAYLKKYPGTKILPMESNDGGGYCECELCQKYGKNGSDRVFRFVKETADIIRKDYPDVLIVILAYGNHEEAPSFRLPDNLRIPVTYNTRNYAKTITDPVNAVYYKRLKDWADNYPGQIVAREMGVKVFFTGWPHPFDDVLAQDVKEYSRLKLAGFFNEGLYPSPLTEYLRITLAWDPDLDVKALTMKFCKGIYGPAAQPMYDYYRLMNERIAQTGKNLDTMTNIVEFTVPIAGRGQKLLNQAEEAVSKMPKYLARVRFEKNNFANFIGAVKMWFPCSKDVITEEIRKANLLPNGSFEQGLKEVTCNTPQFFGCGKFAYNVTDRGVYHGKKAGCITILKKGWGRMIMEAKNLTPGKEYALAAAVKSIEGADLMHIWYKAGNGPAIRLRLGDTKGRWYRFLAEHITADKEGTLKVYMTIHEGPSTGKVLFDDVIVVEQNKMPKR